MCNLSDELKSSSGVPQHIKFVLEWDRPAQTQVINDETDQIEEHASVRQVSIDEFVCFYQISIYGILDKGLKILSWSVLF